MAVSYTHLDVYKRQTLCCSQIHRMNWHLICNRNVFSFAALAFSAPMLSAATGPALSIDAAAGQRAINPDIYGVNQLYDEALALSLIHI